MLRNGVSRQGKGQVLPQQLQRRMGAGVGKASEILPAGSCARVHQALAPLARGKTCCSVPSCGKCSLLPHGCPRLLFRNRAVNSRIARRSGHSPGAVCLSRASGDGVL